MLSRLAKTKGSGVRPDPAALIGRGCVGGIAAVTLIERDAKIKRPD